jgi:hypothetical protein
MSKPINEYTMQECLDRLYDVVGHGYDRKGVEINVLELAWRINTLLYEQAQRHDARVDALENEINALRAENRKPDSPTPSGQVAGMRYE